MTNRTRFLLGAAWTAAVIGLGLTTAESLKAESRIENMVNWNYVPKTTRQLKQSLLFSTTFDYEEEETSFLPSYADYDVLLHALVGTQDINIPPDALSIHLELERGHYLGIGRASVFGGPGDNAGGITAITRQHPSSLDPNDCFFAYRFDYDQFSRRELLDSYAIFHHEGNYVRAIPVDWGPASWTGRKFDLSRGLMEQLGARTDQRVEAWVFPNE